MSVLGHARGERVEEFAVGQRPDPQFSILAACRHELARRCHRLHKIARVGEFAHHAPIGHVVEPQRRIPGTGHSLLSRRQKAHRRHLFLQASDRAHLLASQHVPDLQGGIGSGACQLPAMRLPSHAQHMAGMPFQAFYQRPIGHSMDLDEPIGATRSEPIARPRKLKRRHRVCVRMGDVAHERAIGGIPEFDLSRATGTTAAGSEACAIGREGECRHQIDRRAGRLVIDSRGSLLTANRALVYPAGHHAPALSRGIAASHDPFSGQSLRQQRSPCDLQRPRLTGLA